MSVCPAAVWVALRAVPAQVAPPAVHAVPASFLPMPITRSVPPVQLDPSSPNNMRWWSEPELKELCDTVVSCWCGLLWLLNALTSAPREPLQPFTPPMCFYQCCCRGWSTSGAPAPTASSCSPPASHEAPRCSPSDPLGGLSCFDTWAGTKHATALPSPPPPSANPHDTLVNSCHSVDYSLACYR